MAGGAGLPASWADVVALIQGEDPISFTTTTPAGSGWYRHTYGNTKCEFHYESTGTVASTSNQVLDFTLPTGYKPAGRTALACTTGTSPRVGAANILSDGTINVYNAQGSATTVYVHGEFKVA